MDIHVGRAALSPFRRERLLAALQAAVPEVTGLDERLVVLVHTRRPLTSDETSILAQLLDHGDGVGGAIAVHRVVVRRCARSSGRLERTTPRSTGCCTTA